jgi:hypothetical protein
MRWIYAALGEPMWEWTMLRAEQSVMFYAADGDASSPPPMTDNDCARLEAALRKRNLLDHPYDRPISKARAQPRRQAAR